MIKKRTLTDTGYYRTGDEVGFTRMSQDEERKLFVLYREEGSLVARDAIITNQLLCVAGIAIRIAPDWVSMDEVISAANMALFTAIDKFDWKRDTRFSSYVRKFVRGHVIRACRDKAPVYFPNGREVPPSVTWADKEILPEDSLLDSESADTYADEDHLRYIRKCITLALNEPNISAIERHVIIEYFFKGKTGQRISDEMPKKIGKPNLTRSRIGQLKKGACKRLKANLAKHGITGVL